MIKKKNLESIVSLIVFCLFSNVIITNAYDYYENCTLSGPINNTNMSFYIDRSARSGCLTSSYYDSGFWWNNIDNNAEVAAIATYPAPSSQYTSYFFVAGSSTLECMGSTFFYNSSGTVSNTPYTDTYRISITMCSNSSKYYPSGISSSYSLSQRIENVFAHEVGHAFMLTHPTSPYLSIMQPGIPGMSKVSYGVSCNDELNLKAKW